MTEELKQDLVSINFDKYVEIFEREGLNDFSDLENLSEADYEKIGIVAMGDRKKLVRLYGKQGQTLLVETRIVGYYSSNHENTSPQPTVIMNNTESLHTGIAGVLGGIIGALAVIVIILVILSNETWHL